MKERDSSNSVIELSDAQEKAVCMVLSDNLLQLTIFYYYYLFPTT